MKVPEIPSSSEAKCYAFGPFLLDPLRRLLWRDHRPVALTSRTYDILLHLLEHRDRVVSKDDLLEHIWAGTFVEEGTLVRQVSNLRKALHERPDQHDFVVTVPGRGYRFVARVDVLAHVPVSMDQQGPAEPPDQAVEAPQISGAVPVIVPGFWGRRLHHRWRSWVAVAGAVALAAAAVAIVPALTEPPVEPLRELTQVTSGPGLQHEPTWSPDGESIAYSSDQAGNFDIWVQRLSGASPARVTTSLAQDWQPDWSADGNSIAFRSERDGGGLYVTASSGGAERRIADFGYRPRWSPDGTRVLFARSAMFSGECPELYVVSREGGVPVPVRPDLLTGFRSIHADWHPDGRRISIFGRVEDSRWMFLTAPLDGGAAIESIRAESVSRSLKEWGVVFGRFAWSPSGRQLFFEGRIKSVRNLWRVTVEPESLAWVDTPERLTTGAVADGDVAISPDGARLAFTASTAQTRLWSFPFDSTAGRLTGDGLPITLGEDHDLRPETPANGEKLLYRTVKGRSGELRELSLVDGRDRVVKAGPGAVPAFAKYSPDGTRVAYLRTHSEPRDRPVRESVFISPVAGGPEELLRSAEDLSFLPTDWSSDGHWLAGACRQRTATAARGLAACVVPLSTAPTPGTRARVIAADPGLNLYQERFSPDFQWVAFMTQPASGAGRGGIFVVPLAGTASRWIPIAEDGSFNDKPRWAPDGRTLYYLSDRGGVMNLWGRRFDPVNGVPVGAAFRITSFDAPRQTVSPDLISSVEIAIASNRLIVPLTETSGKIWVLDAVDR